ncbi:hypothetical protein DAI21_17930 [Lelliottia sp. WB101]|nr:hypothetical protein DAI21_17930 [Lelliottia sp. WB101]
MIKGWLSNLLPSLLIGLMVGGAATWQVESALERRLDGAILSSESERQRLINDISDASANKLEKRLQQLHANELRGSVFLAWKSTIRFSVASALLMIICGCSMKPVRLPSAPYQANLTQECPETLPRLNGKTGADFDGVMRPLRSMYTDCAARHNQLVREIKQREKLDGHKN